MAQPAAHSGMEYRIALTLDCTRPASDHHLERWKTETSYYAAWGGPGLALISFSIIDH
tara:strand:- start:1531 stop:1704 length:174 start_codon:yes stop_codon:yes gene_type:complete